MTGTPLFEDVVTVWLLADTVIGADRGDAADRERRLRS